MHLPVAAAGTPTDEVRSRAARKHFQSGQQAYGAGDYNTAQSEFLQSIDLLESGSLTAPTTTSTLPYLAPAILEPIPLSRTGAASNAASNIGASSVIAGAPPAGTSSPDASTAPATAQPASPTTVAGPETAPPADSVTANAPAAQYLIGVGDVLFISVWQVPDLTRDVTVRPDGKISYPLIGDVPAEGLTFDVMDKLLTERLKLYVRDPQVSVELKSMAQQRIVLLGEVNQQGLLAIPGRSVTVPEAIALGQGFKRIGAKVRDVAVLKGYPRHPQLYHVDIKALFAKGEDPQRLVLAGGDIVFVSRSWIGNAHAFIDAAAPALNTIFQGLSTYALYDTIVSKSNTE